MFYEEHEINEIKLCPYCLNNYNDPRLVDCGASFCLQCIELLLARNETGLQCPECGDFHEQPKKGYLKNKSLAKLCDKTAAQVSRSKQADAFQAQLDELKLNLDKLAHENKLGADKIREYCAIKRNEVQLRTEELIERIKSFNMDLIEDVNAYENDSLLYFGQDGQNLDRFIAQMSVFHSDWAGYLKKFKLNDDDLRLASIEAHKHLRHINKQNELLLNKVFSGNVLTFQANTANLGSSLIGTLVNDNYEKQLSNLSAHYIEDEDRGDIMLPILVKCLASEKVCVAYRELAGFSLKLMLYDKSFSKVLSQKLAGQSYREFRLAELNGAIVLCFSNRRTIKKMNSNELSLSLIKKLNSKLNVVDQIGLEHDVISMDVCGSILYCLALRGVDDDEDKDASRCMIYVYDENFVKLRRIGQSSPQMAFFLPSLIYKMQVSESFFIFLLENKEIVVMGKLDGLVKKRIGVNHGDFVLNSNRSRILVYSHKIGQMVSYGFDGRAQKFDWSVDKADCLELVDCFNEKLVFLEPYSLCLYF